MKYNAYKHMIPVEILHFKNNILFLYLKVFCFECVSYVLAITLCHIKKIKSKNPFLT